MPRGVVICLFFPSGGLHPVAAIVFGLVEGFVHPVEERFQRLPLGSFGHAEAAGQLSGQGEGRRFDVLAQALREFQRVDQGGYGREDHELLAAPASQRVGVPDGAHDQRGQFHQHQVAHGVAVGVVYVLEVVDVEHDEAHGHLVALEPGVFSMDGDLAPLDQIYAVSSAHNLMLMVDDAHGEGVVGKGGRGIVDHFNLHGKVDVEVGTLSKAFGVVGGVVAGKSIIVEWLRQRGRPFLFSSAVTPPDVAACLAAVDLLEESTELVDRLWENGRYFKAEMKKLGFDTGLSETPITPVMLGEAPLAQQFSRELYQEGVFAMSIGFPTVPQGKARIRVMISASHNRDDLDFGLQAFAKVGRKLGVIH